MNFLPFVFTFLILLSLLSSFLFSSAFRIARESSFIQAQHQAYLALLSTQAEKSFPKREKKPKKSGEKRLPKKPASVPVTKSKPPRSFHDGCKESKINLSFANNRDFVEKTTIELIKRLYGPCDFYKSSGVKDAAYLIVKELMKEKIESLEELKFDNPKLDEVYYKMLIGTNTGYPSLNEYVRFGEKTDHPIHFHHAPKEVLQAVLGEELAQTVFKKESAKVLKREVFEQVAYPKLSLELINDVFIFSNKKSPPQIQSAEKGKIRAQHPSP